MINKSSKIKQLVEYTPPPPRLKELYQRPFYSELCHANPRSKTMPATPKGYLEHLFPPDAMICAGTRPGMCKTAPITEFGDLRGAHCVVANQMTARDGYTVGDPERGIKPHLSPRCKANTGRALYVVYSGWVGDHDVQASSIILLARDARLAMVVEGYRGNLEAWYFVGEMTIRDIRRIRFRISTSGSGRCRPITCQTYCMPLGIKDRKICLGLEYLDDGPRVHVERFPVPYFDPPMFKPVAG